MRIRDWSSDVFSSDLRALPGDVYAFADRLGCAAGGGDLHRHHDIRFVVFPLVGKRHVDLRLGPCRERPSGRGRWAVLDAADLGAHAAVAVGARSDGACEIGRAPVWTPVNNAQLVCRLLIAKKTQKTS